MTRYTRWVASPCYHWLWAGIYWAWAKLAPRSHRRHMDRIYGELGL
jgi:hypothetical protein